MKTYNNFNEMFNSQSGLKSDVAVFNMIGCVADDVPIPAWALNYLVNGVTDSITAKGKRIVDEWLASFDYPFESVEFCDQNADSYFSKYPEFGSPCNVYDCNIFCDVPDDYPYLRQPKVVNFDDDDYGYEDDYDDDDDDE